MILRRVKPFKDKADNRVSILNEVCLLLVYILLFCLDLIEGRA